MNEALRKRKTAQCVFHVHGERCKFTGSEEVLRQHALHQHACDRAEAAGIAKEAIDDAPAVCNNCNDTGWYVIDGTDGDVENGPCAPTESICHSCMTGVAMLERISEQNRKEMGIIEVYVEGYDYNAPEPYIPESGEFTVLYVYENGHVDREDLVAKNYTCIPHEWWSDPSDSEGVDATGECFLCKEANRAQAEWATLEHFKPGGRRNVLDLPTDSVEYEAALLQIADETDDHDLAMEVLFS